MRGPTSGRQRGFNPGGLGATILAAYCLCRKAVAILVRFFKRTARILFVMVLFDFAVLKPRTRRPVPLPPVPHAAANTAAHPAGYR
jgi:hypothetical protein